MNSHEKDSNSQLFRELSYYRREYNELGARVLRLQEEQSRAFREARRSRAVAHLIREAYLLIERVTTPEEIGNLMLEIVVEHAMCERAAILRKLPGEDTFIITNALGFNDHPAPISLVILSPPPFLFTNSTTRLEARYHPLLEILNVPFLLWAFDSDIGHAIIIGNQSEGNIVRPFEGGDQELIEGALSVYADILLLKQAEVDLRAAKIEAEAANRSKSAFFATLSHELRTPMNAILGFSEFLSSDMSSGFGHEKLREYAKNIHDAGSYLLSIINDILDHSSIEKEGLVLYKECVDVVGLIIDAERAVKVLADRRNISICVNFTERIPNIMVDQKRMMQVLINLLSNAIKFSEEGTSIKIRSYVNNSDGSVVVDVQDSGIGISDEDIARVFDPFVQLKKGDNNPVQGTGLGLPISRSLVEAHGGTLNLHSQLGKGTVATVVLPALRCNVAEVNSGNDATS